MDTIKTPTAIDELKLKIEKARAELSEETKHAIDLVDWKSVILGMRKKRSYSFEQLGNLETETELLLCGLTNPENYPKELENRMKIPRVEVETLVNEMNELVFKKIRDELMKNNQIQINKTTDTEILNKAGIEVTTPSPLLEKEGGQVSPPYGGGDGRGGDSREDMIKKVEEPELIAKEIENEKMLRSISAQKLSGSFQMPNTKTDYSLNNMSKTSKTPEIKKDTLQNGQAGVKVPLGATMKATPSAATSTSPSFNIKVDPYREMPE